MAVLWNRILVDVEVLIYLLVHQLSLLHRVVVVIQGRNGDREASTRRLAFYTKEKEKERMGCVLDEGERTLFDITVTAVYLAGRW